MTKKQYLLLKLIEECAEVAHIAAKQIQFGRDSTNNGKLVVSNAVHLRNELTDFGAITNMLVQIGEIPDISPEEFETASRLKKAKMQKYLNESVALGQLPEITL